jgi:hypothetical protein
MMKIFKSSDRQTKVEGGALTKQTKKAIQCPTCSKNNYLCKNCWSLDIWEFQKTSHGFTTEKAGSGSFSTVSNLCLWCQSLDR